LKEGNNLTSWAFSTASAVNSTLTIITGQPARRVVALSGEIKLGGGILPGPLLITTAPRSLYHKFLGTDATNRLIANTVAWHLSQSIPLKPLTREYQMYRNTLPTMTSYWDAEALNKRIIRL
jgi:hypothetical protein